MTKGEQHPRIYHEDKVPIAGAPSIFNNGVSANGITGGNPSSITDISYFSPPIPIPGGAFPGATTNSAIADNRRYLRLGVQAKLSPIRRQGELTPPGDLSALRTGW